MIVNYNGFRLLVYAMILFENKEYKVTEIFLRAITYLYPRFFEGWTILHLFFIRTEYYPGTKILYLPATIFC